MTTAPALTPAVQAMLADMTPAAIEFMTLVGRRRFDFFDDGIVAGSGIWGRHFAQQAASQMGKSPRSLGGIMARMAGLGLWTCEDQGVEMSGNASDTTWWTLTAIGAEVARYLAWSYDNPLPADEDEEIIADEPVASSVVVPGKLKAHAGCSHPATKAARAACRRAAAKLDREGAQPVTLTPSAEAVSEAHAAAQLIVDTATDADEAIAEIELLRDEDVLPELDADAYADAIMAELGGQQ